LKQAKRISLPMMHPRFLGCSLAVVTILAALGSCRGLQTSLPVEAIAVKMMPVQTGMLSETSDFNASLQSRKSIQLQPQIAGRIARIDVQSGQVVAAGAPLIQIDPAEQTAAVASNLASVQVAQADINNAKAALRALEALRRSRQATLNYNRLQAKRYNALAKAGAVSKQQAQSFTLAQETAQADLVATEADIRAQKSTISQREKNLLQARANTQQQAVVLQYFQVAAPFAGKVGDIPPKQGDMVTPSTSLLTLTQNQPLEVYVYIPIERVSELRIGSAIELLSPQGKVIGTSQVFFISPKADNTTQTVLIKSLYANANDQLRADQQIQARIVWSRRPGVLVPTVAISNLAGQNFVFVAEPGKGDQAYIARQKPVELGKIEGNRYQILKGLQVGEKIITSGIQNLKDGAPIKPES
jgi:RND family efflux transporter MFP subunit